jgi:hypothetical protein
MGSGLAIGYVALSYLQRVAALYRLLTHRDYNAVTASLAVAQ